MHALRGKTSTCILARLVTPKWLKSQKMLRLGCLVIDNVEWKDISKMVGWLGPTVTQFGWLNLSCSLESYCPNNLGNMGGKSECVPSGFGDTCLLSSCAPSSHHFLPEILVGLKFSIPYFSLAVDILGNIQQFSVLVWTNTQIRSKLC